MGKKSLLAPTSEENTSSVKRSEKEKKSSPATGTAKKAAPKPKKKKTTAVAAAKKKATGSKAPKKKSAPKTSQKKKKAPSSKAATAKPSAKTKVRKTTAVKKKPAAKKKAAAKKKVVAKKKAAAVSIKELLKKKFDISDSGRKYSPPSGRQRDAKVSSPPFFVGETAEETERVRRLLFKRFDSFPGDSKDTAGAGEKPSIQKSAKPRVDAESIPPGQTGSGKMASHFSATGTGDIAPEEKKAMDPMQKMAAVGLAVLAVLLIMVLWTSAANVGNFYVKLVDGQLEIWKGRFSPKGVDKIFTLSNASIPAELKEVYSKEEAYAIIFEGVVADADALLGTEEMPDFERIRRTLVSARPFAVSKEMLQRLQRRLDKIDMMALVYKADVLAGKGKVEDLTRARETLEKAMGLNLDEAEKGLIRQKINWVDQKLVELAE